MIRHTSLVITHFFNLKCNWCWIYNGHGFLRGYLLRDVYDDMMLDGVQPVRDTFHALVVGTMKTSRLQDAFYFRDEMKAMGLPPDVGSTILFNFSSFLSGKSIQTLP